MSSDEIGRSCLGLGGRSGRSFSLLKFLVAFFFFFAYDPADDNDLSSDGSVRMFHPPSLRTLRSTKVERMRAWDQTYISSSSLVTIFVVSM